MKWLANLEKNNIPFCIHILQKNDCLIIPTTIETRQITYIIDGFMQILKTFTNGENICMNLLYKNQIIPNIKINIIENTNYYYQIVAKNNNDIKNILVYKNTKRRVIQLLLTMSKHFGKIKPKYIVIPFCLSHHTIAIITGSQRITINRIMYRLKKNKIISYNNQNIK